MVSALTYIFLKINDILAMQASSPGQVLLTCWSCGTRNELITHCVACDEYLSAPAMGLLPENEAAHYALKAAKHEAANHGTVYIHSSKGKGSKGSGSKGNGSKAVAAACSGKAADQKAANPEAAKSHFNG